MSDPERLLTSIDSGDGAELERELLRSIVDVSPPAHAQDDAWDGIAARIAAASALAAGAAALSRAGAPSPSVPAAAAKLAAPPVAAGIAHAFATKAVVGAVVALTATVAVGGLWSKYRATPAPDATANTTATARGDTPAQARDVTPTLTTAPSAPSPTSLDEPAASGAAAPPSSQKDGAFSGRTDLRAGKKSASIRSDEALAAESALLTRARASLRSGDPAGALAALHRLDAQSPHGVLSQEREVLTIEALAASGEHATAARRANAFIEANPNSPHTPSLRRLTDGP